MSYTSLAQSTADWALSKVGCAYSQAKRTQEDIFDCSSLVARAYSAQGKRWKYGGSVPTSNNEIYDDDFELLWPATYAQIGKSFGGASIINMAKTARRPAIPLHRLWHQPCQQDYPCDNGSYAHADRPRPRHEVRRVYQLHLPLCRQGMRRRSLQSGLRAALGDEGLPHAAAATGAQCARRGHQRGRRVRRKDAGRVESLPSSTGP